MLKTIVFFLKLPFILAGFTAACALWFLLIVHLTG